MPAEFYRAPPTYSNIQEAVKWLKSQYTNFKAFPIGKSVQGRDIMAFCLGNPAGSTVYLGGVRGYEWFTGTVLLRFYRDLIRAVGHGGCVSDIDVKNALADRPVTIIPCLNPDGAELSLKGADTVTGTNAGGVDLYRNFDAGHKKIPAGEFGGGHPGSEPETAALVSFCLHYRPRNLYSLHLPGEAVHFHYGKNTPVRSRMIGRILASSAGYALARPDSQNLHGSPAAWFIEKNRKPGFVIEIGRADTLPGLAGLDRTYLRIEEMLMLAALL